MPTLGVNVDHVATVRQARMTDEPDPTLAAVAAERAGADQITIHLREDRRHIQDADLDRVKQAIKIRLNLECAVADEMLTIACNLKPFQVCLVPEKREEVTTEGGLDVVTHRDKVAAAVKKLHDADIKVSLFIDPDLKQIEMAKELDVYAVELHTGCYANATEDAQVAEELKRIEESSRATIERGIHLHAGHGLTYQNVKPIAQVSGMEELNIGHSIVSRAIFVGFESAVREMKQLIQ